jgi:hypothetical protein
LTSNPTTTEPWKTTIAGDPVPSTCSGHMVQGEYPSELAVVITRAARS